MKCRLPQIVRILLLLLLLDISFFCSGCIPPKKTSFKTSEIIMDTIWDIEVVTDDIRVKTACQKVFFEVRHINSLLSHFELRSDICKINSQAGKNWVSVAKGTISALKEGKGFGKLSRGLFDITIGPLTSTWNIKSENPKIPSEENIEYAKQLVDYKSLLIREKSSKAKLAKEGMSLDVGGIGKGIALDRASEVLKGYGFKDFLINAGGEVLAHGYNKYGMKWRVGIQHPRKENKIFKILELSDEIASTSGDYQRYFLKNGKRYHHILDPRTGKPARKSISVTVILSGTDEKQATIADALSTWLFIVGCKDAKKILKEFPGARAFFITEQDGEIKEYMITE